MSHKAFNFQEALMVGIIDSKRLCELYELDDGSIDFALTLVDDLIAEKENFFSDLDSSLRLQNLAALGRTAHKLKSTLSNVAAGRASLLCASIERLVATRPPIDTIIVMVENLKMEISSFLNAFNSCRS